MKLDSFYKRLLFILIVLYGISMFMAGYKSNQTIHTCHEAEYKKAFLDCMKDREKVREILKGDSLKTLLYW